MPAEEPDAGIYAEGFSAENFVAPPEVEDPNQNLTDAFSLLEDLPQVLESLDDQVPAAIHELCDQLYHRTQWHKAHPVLDKLAVSEGGEEEWVSECELSDRPAPMA